MIREFMKNQLEGMDAAGIGMVIDECLSALDVAALDNDEAYDQAASEIADDNSAVFGELIISLESRG